MRDGSISSLEVFRFVRRVKMFEEFLRGLGVANHFACRWIFQQHASTLAIHVAKNGDNIRGIDPEVFEQHLKHSFRSALRLRDPLNVIAF